MPIKPIQLDREFYSRLWDNMHSTFGIVLVYACLRDWQVAHRDFIACYCNGGEI